MYNMYMFIYECRPLCRPIYIDINCSSSMSYIFRIS